MKSKSVCQTVHTVCNVISESSKVGELVDSREAHRLRGLIGAASNSCEPDEAATLKHLRRLLDNVTAKREAN